jgi:hypothetical protein
MGTTRGRHPPVPAAKWQAIAEYIWLLRKVEARRVFMVFGQDVEVAVRYLDRVRPSMIRSSSTLWTETDTRLI